MDALDGRMSDVVRSKNELAMLKREEESEEEQVCIFYYTRTVITKDERRIFDKLVTAVDKA